MRYCTKCGNRLDDFDSYCGNCGTKVEERSSYSKVDTSKQSNDGTQDKRTTVEDSINNFTEIMSKNPESFICLLLGILSLTFGTFICAIVSLVFAKKAVEKGQDKDEKCATFCKVGRICSKVSIALTAIAVIVFVGWGIIGGIILPIFVGL